MCKLNQIELNEFQNNKQNGKYAILIDNEKDVSVCYELEINEDVTIAILGNTYYKPYFKKVFDYYAVWYMGTCFFYSADDLKEIKSFDDMVYVYDVLDLNKSIIIVSEIDIYVLSRELSEINHIILNDIVTKYDVLHGVLNIELANGETQKIQKM